MELRITEILDGEQKRVYQENGYLVVEGFASDTECESLKRRMGELVNAFDVSTVSVFSSKNPKKQLDDYFIDSASQISFFFEEGAFDEVGTLTRSKELSINKVGHALHDLDATFGAFSRSQKMASLVSSLGYKRPIPIQSQYIFKQPSIGGEVLPHQDNTYLYTDPDSVVGFWIALEDADVTNGCIWVYPSSHQDGLASRFTTADGACVYDREKFLSYHDSSKYIPVEMKAGSLLVLHGDIWHLSYENKSVKSRHAFTLHVAESDTCVYSEGNWLQRNASLPFKPLYFM